MPLDEAALASAVERHDFDNPHSPQEKGPDKKRRKATPGAWREDLTPEQTRTVERVCRPMFKAFYA